MGNVLCRHKDQVGGQQSATSLRSPFDRIISRVQLCPSNLNHGGPDHNKRNCNKCESKTQSLKPSPNPNNEQIFKKQTNLQTTQWYDETDTTDRDKIKSIFADLIDPKTPIPPPRFNKQQRLSQQLYKDQEPVHEVLITKTIAKKHICDIDENRFTKQHIKHHSTVSLPNINELQLSVAADDLNNEINDPKKSVDSLVLLKNNKKNFHGSKLEMYMTRCRSFGSLLPHKLQKLTTPSRRGEMKKTGSYNVESDDSWAGLEDWDLRIIEYYKPHDSSLPRQFPPLKSCQAPVAPQRKTDTLLRKLNKQKQIEVPNNRLSLVQQPTDKLQYLDAKINDLRSEPEPIYESLKSVHNEDANKSRVPESFLETMRSDPDDIKQTESIDITYDEAKEISENIINDIENEVNRRLNKNDHNVPIVTACITKMEKSTETLPMVSTDSVDNKKLRFTEINPVVSTDSIDNKKLRFTDPTSKVQFKTDDNEHSTLLKILSQESLNSLDSEPHIKPAVSLSDILRSPSKNVKESDDARQKFV